MVKVNDLTEKTTSIASWDKVLIIDSEASDATKIAPASNFVWPKWDTGDTWPTWPAWDINNAKYCIAHISTTQSIPDDIETKVLLDVYEDNDSSMEATNEINITTAWIYNIVANVSRTSAESTATMNVYKNWGAFSYTYITDSSGSEHARGSLVASLAVWDKIDVRVYQNRWSSKTLAMAVLSVNQVA